MQGSEPVTGKMPVPQVLPLKWKHYSFSRKHFTPPQIMRLFFDFDGYFKIFFPFRIRTINSITRTRNECFFGNFLTI